jgi:hypothetical protein
MALFFFGQGLFRVIRVVCRATDQSISELERYSSRQPTEAALRDRAGFHGLLNFVSKRVKVFAQPIEHVALG